MYIHKLLDFEEKVRKGQPWGTLSNVSAGKYDKGRYRCLSTAMFFHTKIELLHFCQK